MTTTRDIVPGERGRATVALVVVIVTYRRTEPLKSLVPALLTQIDELEAARREVSPRALVVDNDPDGSARLLLSDVEDHRLSVLVEPMPGIPAARSRALAAAQNDDLLVFIDDDEVPGPGWLLALYTCWRNTGAAAVAGPVRTEFPEGTDPFVVDGQFYQRLHTRSWETGDVLPMAATNNLLLDLSVVRRLELRFDERFRTTGGEDSAFTTALRVRGERIVWCKEAEVVEQLLPQRTSREAALGRAYALANSRLVVGSLIAPDAAARRRLRWRALGAALRYGALGGFRSTYGRMASMPGAYAQGRRDLARFRGVIDALRGRQAQPYARPHA